MTATAVFGVPLHNHADHLEEAVDSLLAQTFRDLAVVLVDDASTDATPELARALAARDGRVTHLTNERRLGMIENWRRAFACARALHPEARYFAWGSDHDRWHPEWLERLVAVLDEDPTVVLAYPLFARLDDAGGEHRRTSPSTFATRSGVGAVRRFAATLVAAPAGSLVYGLHRVDALERAGVFPRTVMPDRLLLAELALQGRLALCPELLWWRRYQIDVSAARQRRMLFTGTAPLFAHLPWFLQHGAALGWRLGVRGAARPAVSRSVALTAASAYAPLAGARAIRRRSRRTLRRVRRARRVAVARARHVTVAALHRWR